MANCRLVQEKGVRIPFTPTDPAHLRQQLSRRRPEIQRGEARGTTQMIEGLLRYDPDLRMSAVEARTHFYFTEQPLPKDANKMRTFADSRDDEDYMAPTTRAPGAGGGKARAKPSAGPSKSKASSAPVAVASAKARTSAVPASLAAQNLLAQRRIVREQEKVAGQNGGGPRSKRPRTE